MSGETSPSSATSSVVPLTFKDELKLLGRILYKNKNQHRHGKYFQALDMAYRWLKKLDAKSIEATTLETKVTEALESAKTAKEFVAVMEETERLLQLLVECANVADKSRIKCVFAAERVSGLVAQGWFLPFAVVSMATSARLESYAQQQITTHLESFDRLAGVYLRRLRLLLQKDPRRGEFALKAVQAINDATAAVQSGVRERYRTQLQTKAVEQKAISVGDDVGDAVVREGEQPKPKKQTIPKQKARTSTSSTKSTPKRMKEG